MQFNYRCYYGLSFASTSLSGDAFTNFLLRWGTTYIMCLMSCPSVFIEIPSAICCILVIDCWGRRPTLSFCQVTNLLLTRPGGFWPCLRRLWLAARSPGSWASGPAGEDKEDLPSTHKNTPFLAGFVSRGQVRCFHLFLHCLPLHGRAVPNNSEEPGCGHLFLGGKDWWDHRTASWPHQSLLVACASVHHGGHCHSGEWNAHFWRKGIITTSSRLAA